MYIKIKWPRYIVEKNGENGPIHLDAAEAVNYLEWFNDLNEKGIKFCSLCADAGGIGGIIAEISPQSLRRHWAEKDPKTDKNHYLPNPLINWRPKGA